MRSLIDYVIFNIKIKLETERCKMVNGYTILIMHGRTTIDQVPARHKEAVLENLRALGLDGYGNPLPVEPVTP